MTYHPEPVDAVKVPAEMTGLRTMFQAFHHLRLDQARAALADAAAKGQGVAIFDGSRLAWWLWPLLLITPLRVLLATPFIRPFRWSRLFWTYIVPALPLVLTFDVVVSLLRLYSVEELRGLTAGLEHYHWEKRHGPGQADSPEDHVFDWDAEGACRLRGAAPAGGWHATPVTD